MVRQDKAPAGAAQTGCGRVVRWIAGTLLLLLAAVLGVLAYLAFNADRLARELVEAVPVEQESILGDLALIEIGSQLRLRDAGPAVEAVRLIGERLTAGSRFKYRWYVGERGQVNAISAPGGLIVVYSGMIAAASSAEELAGVLAHEVAHTELRHRMRAEFKGLGLTGLLRLLMGDASAGGRLGQLGERKFSRDAEAEADADGVRRLSAAGIDPLGMVAIYQKLINPEAEAATAASPLLATHPATAERISALRQEIAAQESAGGARTYLPLPIDWSVVQKSLDRSAP